MVARNQRRDLRCDELAEAVASLASAVMATDSLPELLGRFHGDRSAAPALCCVWTALDDPEVRRSASLDYESFRRRVAAALWTQSALSLAGGPSALSSRIVQETLVQLIRRGAG